MRQTPHERAMMAAIRKKNPLPRVSKRHQHELEAGAAVGGTVATAAALNPQRAKLALRVFRHPLTRLARGFVALKLIKKAGEKSTAMLEWRAERRALTKAARMLKKAVPDEHGMWWYKDTLLPNPTPEVWARANKPRLAERAVALARRHPKTTLAASTVGLGLALHRRYQKRRKSA